eukprot:238886-Amphidinium_carterae.1
MLGCLEPQTFPAALHSTIGQRLITCVCVEELVALRSPAAYAKMQQLNLPASSFEQVFGRVHNQLS